MSLVIKNLHAKVQGTEILKGINLEIPKGEVHAIMGPNGSGKSTLSKVLCGHPDYEVTEGEVWLDGQNLLDMSIDERSRAGLFLAFQYPMEVPGVSNANFLRAAMQARMPPGGGTGCGYLLQDAVCKNGPARHVPQIHLPRRQRRLFRR